MALKYENVVVNQRSASPENGRTLSSMETFEKYLFLFKFKEGENFNRRNTSSILRIKI